MREPIAQPEVAAAEYEIKLNFVSMVQQDQFGGSASEDVGMHLHNFTELCNMTRIRDYDLDDLNLRLFPFSLRGKAKERLIAFCLEEIRLHALHVVTNYYLGFATCLCNFDLKRF